MESIVITTSNTVNTGVEKITPEQRCCNDAFLTIVLWIALAGFPLDVCSESKLNKILMLLKHKVELFLCDRISTSSFPQLFLFFPYHVLMVASDLTGSFLEMCD